ncbi:RNA-binding protein [Stenotrophomonas pictorum JCM 9942]|jgi:ribosome-associated protein|uniref:RNA-binding protein n=1 Tax=Stenotrophomonas pictorum JCM 9942 TaxID=1236960 RepID=A0A0R0A3K7_9GAMM|nr:RNA-binding S4 domain-containing protein [Stenotrophomonas pictorum]KRG39337.1 RNA-binding protein [Stenotrophomonas pictorum JCM 9942]
MQTIEFELDREYVELKQLLKLTDLVSSGGEAKVIIGEGQVQVDGAVELRKACKIRAGQQVQLGDVLIRVTGEA